jgi:hypothetical protein
MPVSITFIHLLIFGIANFFATFSATQYNIDSRIFCKEVSEGEVLLTHYYMKNTIATFHTVVQRCAKP